MIGRYLLHYRILSLLGSGGMGKVYLALDEKLGREVALKILPPREGDEGERLRQEARSLAALNHPNIVTIHAVEEVDGQPFLVMERVIGTSLESRVRPGGLGKEEFFQIALPLCEAVAAAHDRGILHRDLKPGNVMITAEGRLKVLDFGLAEAVPAAAELGKTATEVPTVVGTLPYMAPEVVEGKTVDARADVFSLGILLHELATGWRPFRGDTMTGLMLAILRNQRTPSPYESSLPPTLASVIDVCLASRPEQRFPSARELHQQLHIVRSHSEADFAATQARTSLALALPRAPRAFRRVAGMAALALLAVGSLALAFYGSRPTAPPAAAVAEAESRKKIVVLPFENLGDAEDAYFTAGMTEEITSRLAGLRQLGVISRTSALQYPPGKKSLETIGRELGVHYVLEGTVRWDRLPDGRRRVRVTPQLIQVEGDVHLWSERYDRVLDDLFAVQSEIARSVIDQLNVHLVPAERAAFDQQLAQIPTTHLEAYQAYLRGRDLAWFITSLDQAAQATLFLQRAVELDPRFVQAWCELAGVHSQAFHWGLDRSAERAALAAAAIEKARALAPDSPDVHRTYGFFLYWTQRDYAGGLREFELAIAAAPNDVRAREGRAFIERRQGRIEAAVEEMRAVVELNPRDGRARRELGVTATYLRQYDEALRELELAIQLSQDPMAAYLSQTRVYWLLGDFAAARAKLAARPPLEHDLPHWYGFWQNVYEDRLDAAVAELDQVRSAELSWSTVYAPVPQLRALVYSWQGKKDQARAQFTAALELIDRRLTQEVADPRLHAVRAQVLAGLGRASEARGAIAKAEALVEDGRDYVAAMDVLYDASILWTQLGERAAALTALEKLLAQPSGLSGALLARDPRWQDLRQEERFARLVRRP